ncbi:hypothetical protein Q3O59_13695 [Alkalimonas delamerensis]|uniref:Uncharacterized protein n=1 Tax=Alkalimonas delamerensis TaxID=265981 RepID=A0ABT9GSX6_9GAMM|nr:hypothetical protein [Alkalimonas delamerensis]MDP4530076.1 hypothetical protein [Alkalimonas delamerensis]
MDINAAVLGQFMFFFLVFVGITSYFLARRKTNTPILATLIGVLLAIVPPLGLIYLAALVLKEDVTAS